jgi:hypothetical protein
MQNLRHTLRFFKTVVKLIIASICLVALTGIIYLNIKLHDKPEIRDVGGQPVNFSLVKQLNYLDQAINDGAAHDMQAIYPEGFVFMHALYALAWCDFAERLDSSNVIREHAVNEVTESWKAIDSPVGRAQFDIDVSPRYGIFYRGWSNYVLAKKLRLQKGQGDSLETLAFKKNCQDIAASFGIALYPESYQNMRWPADAVPALASLSIHDELYTPQYMDVTKGWISRVRSAIGPGGQIPHADDELRVEFESPRGSSQSLMLAILIEIDSAFAREQFAIYHSRFVDDLFGLSFIREYPDGTSGNGDVDSGPVVMNIGSAATIVGLRTLSTFGERSEAACIRNCVEAFGVPTTTNDQKKYLLGKLPIADAFIAWAMSEENFNAGDNSDGWQLTFHLYSIIPLVLIMLLMAYLFKPKH